MASGLSASLVQRLSGGASRLAALLLPQILPVSSVVAPCQPGAALRNPLHNPRGQATGTYGAAGRVAAAFVHSKLTPLFILFSMALGALAVVALPREEEPQIIVPMVDVFVEMPGATPADVEQRVTRPMEQLLWEVPGVE